MGPWLAGRSAVLWRSTIRFRPAHTPGNGSRPLTGVAAAGRGMTTLSVRLGMPPGTLPVGVGVLGLGVSAYVFLVLAGRGLGPHAFATLSAVWVLVYTAGPGLFVPLEQEVGRAVSARLAVGQGAAPVLLLGRRVTIVAAAIVTMLLALPSSLVLDRVLDGSWLLLAALGIAVWALAGAHLSRGVLSGTGQFTRYGAQLATEGALRALACLGLVALSVRSAEPYGLVLGTATLVAVLFTVRGAAHGLGDGPPASVRELSHNLGLLLTASVLSQCMANYGPLAVKLLARPDEQVLAGNFLAGVVVARVPLFMFASVQAVLLPRLAALAARERTREFRRALAGLCALVAAVGLMGILAALAVGPEGLRLVFGPQFALSRLDLVLLAASSAVFMLAVVLSQSLVALERHAAPAMAWALGALVVVVVTVVAPGLLLRVELGMLAGTTATALALATALVTVGVSRPLPGAAAGARDVGTA